MATDETPETDSILRQQIAYYSARAEEYDEWFLRQGRYDRGPESSRDWFRETDEIRAALDEFKPAGRVLELACGTGLWTEHLARYAAEVTAVDASPEVLEINRKRLGQKPVKYVQADLFNWVPDGTFDVVFFSFFLSHVPQERFEGFWQMVRKALSPSGRVFFIDSRYSESSTALDHRLDGPSATTVKRRLNDGREFVIVKIFYDPAQLEARMSALGWTLRARTTANYFIYGDATIR